MKEATTATAERRTTVRDRVELVMRLNDGRYLGEILSDPRWPASIGKIRCPGGKIEPGETPCEALLRELQEEYSISITSAELNLLSELNGPRGRVVRYETAAPDHWIGLVAEGANETLVVIDYPPQTWF